MKLNRKFILIIIVLLIGALFYGLTYEPKPEESADGPSLYTFNTKVVSTDEFVVQVDEDSLIILEGTSQEEVLSIILASNGSNQSYRFTTSEGSEKSVEQLFSYDRLYVTAQNGVTEGYYIIKVVDTLN
ncbi:MAG: hypothetical protein K9L74_03370 [Candidatus Izimaplasma sp.]|nr:hypothetical protein [Candidatus Izimaplasma bacterium]